MNSPFAKRIDQPAETGYGWSAAPWSVMLVLLVLATGSTHGVYGQTPAAEAPTATQLRAAMLQPQAAAPERQQVANGRSVPLAFALSAALPGAGQVYNRQWVKAAVAFGLEVALFVGYQSWRQRGLDGRDAYLAYAHEHWDPAKYARWLNDYRAWLVDEQGRVIGTPPAQVPTGIDFSQPDSWDANTRALVRSFFEDIRTLESDNGVVHVETGATFSHKLPFFGEQQYYELIGKYFQYAPGWEDYPDWLADGEANQYIDPERTGPNGTKANVAGRFYEYASDHARANDFLRRSSRLSAVFVVNHVLSAFDAAISARLHNNRVDTDMRLTIGAFGDVQPMASLRVWW